MAGIQSPSANENKTVLVIFYRMMTRNNAWRIVLCFHTNPLFLVLQILMKMETIGKFTVNPTVKINAIANIA